MTRAKKTVTRALERKKRLLKRMQRHRQLTKMAVMSILPVRTVKKVHHRQQAAKKRASRAFWHISATTGTVC